VDYWLQAQWEAGKRVSLADFDPALAVVHIPHGPLTANWNGARGARGGWEYAGQSNLVNEQAASKRWPVPSRVRRINMATAVVQDEILWDGGRNGDGPVWPTRAEPGAVYEYSIRRHLR